MTATVAAQCRLTDKLIERVETSLRHNPCWGAAADYAGITDKTLHRYRQRAAAYRERVEASEQSEMSEDPDYPYAVAAERWMEARSSHEKELMDKARELALAGNAQVLLGLLKMGWRDRYADRLEITGADGGPVEVSHDERVAELVERAKACNKKPPRKKATPKETADA